MSFLRVLKSWSTRARARALGFLAIGGEQSEHCEPLPPHRWVTNATKLCCDRGKIFGANHVASASASCPAEHPFMELTNAGTRVCSLQGDKLRNAAPIRPLPATATASLDGLTALKWGRRCWRDRRGNRRCKWWRLRRLCGSS